MITANAQSVLEKRYYLKDDSGVLIEKTPEDLWGRVSRAVAEPERVYSAEAYDLAQANFYGILLAGDFTPNSPAIANAGARTGQCSACFVLPLEDDLGGIFDTVKHTALIHQTGGGTGFSLSRLRPKDDFVRSTGGKSSGPLTFADVLNAATESIKQGGMRRGANMGMLRIDHPDILDFIEYKDDLTKLTNFNISVAVTQAFLDAYDAGTSYDLINPRTGAVTGSLDARTVMKNIVHHAWKTGEPGLAFIDRMNEYCPVPWMGQYEATNPCGEQPLLPYESCNLGSIDLAKFVVETPTGPALDWNRLAWAIHVGTHFLDNIVSINQFPIPELKRMSDLTRKIGLGVMGWARLLLLLGIGYGSDESLSLARQVASFLDYHSKLASIELAKWRGSFPARAGHEDEFNAFFDRICAERQAKPDRHPSCDYISLAELQRQYGIRNSNTTTEAPTGTISIIAGTTGGIEPIFALAFKRWQADMHMLDSEPTFEAFLAKRGFDAERLVELLRQVDENHGTLTGLDVTPYSAHEQSIIDAARPIFTVAHDVTPRQHIETQAAWQDFNDSAISKTVNFDESATEDDVEEVYKLAILRGCKGVTVYRNNSRKHQPLSVSEKPAADLAAPEVAAAIARAADRILATEPRERRTDLYGYTREVKTGEGNLYLTLNYDEQGLREVFGNLGRSGGTLHSLTEAIGRLASLALQFNVPRDEVARALVGIRGPEPVGFGPRQILSIPDAIGKAIASAPRSLNGELPTMEAPREAIAKQPVPVAAEAKRLEAVAVYGKSPDCPECSSRLDFGEGCMTCHSCGYSKCS
jgi:ribonucleoside-diphosphate reductase alpha chain